MHVLAEPNSGAADFRLSKEHANLIIFQPGYKGRIPVYVVDYNSY